MPVLPHPHTRLTPTSRYAIATSAMPGWEVVAAPPFTRTQLAQAPNLRVDFRDTSVLNQTSPWQAAAKEGLVEFAAVEPSAITTFTASSNNYNSTEQLHYLGQQARQTIDGNLDATGAVLLRNLPVRDAASCEAFVDGLGYTHKRYEPFGGSRKKVGKLYAATNIPGHELLDIHNEMVYNPHPTSKILLICLQHAQEGGESMLASGEAITSAIPQHIKQVFADKGGIKYKRTYSSATAEQPDPAAAEMGPHAMTWQQKTGSDNKAGAEAFFRNLGCQTEWTGPTHDTLIAYNTLPAIIKHPKLGMSLWFNLAVAGSFEPDGPITFADGSVISKELVRPVVEARMAATRVMKLQAGDVLVLDNFRYLHGRLPYKGDERLLVTVLTSD